MKYRIAFPGVNHLDAVRALQKAGFRHPSP
jgi:hypothetical protein